MSNSNASSRKFLHIIYKMTPLLAPIILSIFPLTTTAYLQPIPWLVYLSSLIFYLIHLWIENLSYDSMKTEHNDLKATNIILLVVVAGLIYYISRESSWLNGIILIIYSLLIHFQYTFISYRMGSLAVILLALFKAFLIPFQMISSLVGFIPDTIIILGAVFFLPLLMIESARYERLHLHVDLDERPALFGKQATKINRLGIVLSIPVAIIASWSLFSWASLSLILVFYITLRWNVLFNESSNQKLARIHFISLSIIYLILWVGHLLIQKFL